MIDTEDRALDFLEHYGVKGMRWGVRKSKSSSSSEQAAQAKRSRRKTAAKVVAVTAVVAGAAYMSRRNKINAATKVSSLPTLSEQRRVFQSKIATSSSLIDRHGPVRVNGAIPMPIASAAKKKSLPKLSMTVAEVRKEMGARNVSANRQLTALYDKGQVPFPDRQYLKVSDLRRA